MKNVDVAVIGGGAAGMAAALEAEKNGAGSVIIIERGDELGGILQQCIHNGFGSLVFKKDLPGPTYAKKFIDQVRNSNIEIILDSMVIDLTPQRFLTTTGKKTGYQQIQAGAVVLAMGCRERTRAQIMLPGSHPAGVYTAGTVQRFVNIEGYLPGKKFVILGSGDIGMIMARRLTLEGADVIKVVEILPFLTGLRRNYVQCLQDFDIPLELSTTIKRVIGDVRLEAVKTVKVNSSLNPIPGTEEIIPCDTLLLSVGLIPENELSLKAGITLDPMTAGPLIDQNRETSIPGIFSAGNVVNIQDLVDHVSMTGETAGRSAALFSKNQQVLKKEMINIQCGENIRTVVPQRISLPEEGKVTLQMRSGQFFEKPVEIILSAGNDKIISWKKKYARPAEMLEVKIDMSSMDRNPGATWKIELVPSGEN